MYPGVVCATLPSTAHSSGETLMLKFLSLIGLLGILGAIAAAVFFFGGYYSVAASAEEPAIVKWILVHVRTASIERHGKDKPPMSLDDPAVVQAGARALSPRGRGSCHGAPGVPRAEISQRVRPAPPEP